MKMSDKEDEERLVLEKVIKELDYNFIRNKEHELYKFIMETVEKPLIEMVLEKTFGNQLKASQILGINRNTLHYNIKKLNIDVMHFKR